MMKFAIGGQLTKNEIKAYVEQHASQQAVADIFTDVEAAMLVKNGTYDYYVGACQSGAGGALAMAYGVLGRDKCATISMAGRAPKKEVVEEAVKKGVKAFGFTNDHVEQSMKLLLDTLLEKE
ncbi:Protein of unknown function DUF2620 [Seinonella peptonophila]|uniref:DUF2620 domain-containing protein n=1 Tax=Seinonella peptonophila TaxID=112248 RepID=A0A1M4Z8V2_9BACL|nr:DUF2620 domain-containing protein [Seinonella peptonophila]SHF14489.1 Protein of unknown function DUF2620 [Seinonella peptonophila]